MICNTLRLPLAEIDPRDLTYRITTRPCTDDLVVSIGMAGLLNPPMLKRLDQGGFGIVSGFRRVEALSRLHVKDIDARVFDENAGPFFLALCAITDNSFQRELNLIEQSRALNLLQSCLDADQDLCETAAKLGLPAHPRMIHKIRRLAEMPEPIRNMILSGALSLGMIDEFIRLDDDEAAVVGHLFEQLQVGLMKQRELMENLREIALRDRIRIGDVIGSSDIQDVLDSDDPDRNEKSRRIRDLLKRRRFPAITSSEEHLDRAWRALSPGGGASLKPPPYFEGDVFSMNLQFRDADDLRKHRDLLDRMIVNPQLKSFFKKPVGGFR